MTRLWVDRIPLRDVPLRTEDPEPAPKENAVKTKHHAGFLNIEDSNAQLRAGQRIHVDVVHVRGVRWLVMVMWPNGSGTTDRVWFRWRATRQAARRRRELADLAPFVAPETP